MDETIIFTDDSPFSRLVNLLNPAEKLPPSGFSRGVAEELQALADLILAGERVVVHFSLTVKEDVQKLEIEVA